MENASEDPRRRLKNTPDRRNRTRGSRRVRRCPSRSIILLCKTRNTGDIEITDKTFIEVPVLRVRVFPVFIERICRSPFLGFAKTADYAAGAMLFFIMSKYSGRQRLDGCTYFALIAMNENRMVPGVKEDLEDFVDDSIRITSLRIFVCLDEDAVVRDVVFT